MAGYMKEHICKCGNAFVGGINAKYCPACREKRQKEAVRSSHKKEREREKLLAAEGNKGKKKGPNTKQCRGCWYWQRISGVGDVKHCCHYLLYTGKRRERDGDRCLSRTTEAVAVKKSPWPDYQTGDSVYAGYGRK